MHVYNLGSMPLYDRQSVNGTTVTDGDKKWFVDGHNSVKYIEITAHTSHSSSIIQVHIG